MQRSKWFGSLIAVLMLVVFLLPQEAKAASYEYKNTTYGFSITCPQKPVGVLELATISPEEKGVVLVFENEGYDIKYAWVISDDAFDEESLPDFAKLSPDETQNYFKKLLAGKKYDMATLVSVAGGPALYTVSKGEPKQVATYFRANNKRYAVMLIDNPTLNKDRMNAYQTGVLSFKTFN